MSLFSIFSLPKNSEQFDRGIYLSRTQKIGTLLFFYLFPGLIIYSIMVPLSFIPYPFDWYLLVAIFFGSLFLNGFYFWAKGGVFFLFCWLLNLPSFRYLPFVFSLLLPAQTVTLNSNISELKEFKGRVVYVQDIPIRKENISKKIFTQKNRYLFSDRKSHDVEIKFQVAPIYPSSDTNQSPWMIAYVNSWEDWIFSEGYYLIPTNKNLVYGNYFQNKLYVKELETTDLYVGTPVDSLFWPRLLTIFFLFIFPISSILLAFKIHPDMLLTKEFPKKNK